MYLLKRDNLLLTENDPFNITTITYEEGVGWTIEQGQSGGHEQYHGTHIILKEIKADR